MNESFTKEIVELDTGVYAWLHHDLTNSGFIVGDKGVLIIDSLRVPSFAKELIGDIKRITNKPVSYVIDTHSHWDHSWGNEIFPDATIIGHQNCYNEMIDIEWNNAWRRSVIDDASPWSTEASTVNITPPNLTYTTSMSLYFGQREIVLHHLGKAHTSGDTFIHLPEERLLFTGDVAQSMGIPYFGDCYPEDWPMTDDKMLSLDVERFISGHGPIGTYRDLVDARNFLHHLINFMRQKKTEGQSETEAVFATRDSLIPEFGEWRGFERIEQGLALVYQRITQSNNG
jgi:glyoxylase-like metal-dependent hydrolase (beta-lactamase superfamily II)